MLNKSTYKKENKTIRLSTLDKPRHNILKPYDILAHKGHNAPRQHLQDEIAAHASTLVGPTRCQTNGYHPKQIFEPTPSTR